MSAKLQENTYPTEVGVVVKTRLSDTTMHNLSRLLDAGVNDTLEEAFRASIIDLVNYWGEDVDDVTSFWLITDAPSDGICIGLEITLPVYVAWFFERLKSGPYLDEETLVHSAVDGYVSDEESNLVAQNLSGSGLPDDQPSYE